MTVVYDAMGNLKDTYHLLPEPDKGIIKILIDFYEMMKDLEDDPERGGKQATMIIMALNDIKYKIDEHTSTRSAI